MPDNRLYGANVVFIRILKSYRKIAVNVSNSPHRAVAAHIISDP